VRWSSALSVRVWLLTDAETKAAGEVIPVHWKDAEAEFFRRFEELKQLHGGAQATSRDSETTNQGAKSGARRGRFLNLW